MKNMSLIQLKSGVNEPDKTLLVKKKIEEIMGREIESYLLVGSYDRDTSFGSTYGKSVALGGAMVSYLNESPNLIPLFDTVIKVIRFDEKLRAKAKDGSSMDEIIDVLSEELKRVFGEKESEKKEKDLPEFFSRYPKCKSCGIQHPTRWDIESMSSDEQNVAILWILNNVVDHI